LSVTVAIDISEVHRFSLEEYHLCSPSEDAYEQVGEVGAGGTLTSEVLGPLELRVDDLLAEAGF